jgi:hypothetical protein
MENGRSLPYCVLFISKLSMADLATSVSDVGANPSNPIESISVSTWCGLREIFGGFRE